MPVAAAPITANTGWIEDTLESAYELTVGSPYTFTLSAGQTAIFKVTDQFVEGDTLFLYNGATLLATSSYYAGAAHTIIGESFGTTPAGLYVRLDVVDSTGTDVPEPASLALIGLGLLGLSGLRRRQRA